MKKILAVFLIPLLCFFSYQAIISGITSVQLNNASYFLYQNIQYGLTEQQFVEKMQAALDRVKQLEAIKYTGIDNPQYHKLLASLNLWQASFSKSPQQKQITLAQRHYHIGLRAQPNNSFLWRRLAQTDLDYSDIEFSLGAIKQASYYAPSDNKILLDVILWKIPIWNQLYHQQQNETIQQIKYYAQSQESKHKSRVLLNKILRANKLKTTICERLPKSQKFNLICR